MSETGLRGERPERPTKPWGWVGLLVKSRQLLSNAYAELPPGTVFLVRYSRSGLDLRSKRCDCCGVSIGITKVHPSAVEPVFAPTFSSPPDYPHRMWGSQIDEAWEQYDWCLDQVAKGLESA